MPAAGATGLNVCPFVASALDNCQSASTMLLRAFSELRYNRISRSSVHLLSPEQMTRPPLEMSFSTRLSGGQQTLDGTRDSSFLSSSTRC